MNKVLFNLFCLCILLHGHRVGAQISVTPVNTGVPLVQTLAGPGITISNIQYTGPNDGAGNFTCTNCNIGMPAGIVLTSGWAEYTEGPNAHVAITGTNPQVAGDSDLDAIVNPLATHDACILEFDLQTQSDSIEFRYVFGSDEYPEFVCSPFNDVFAFFISGPGIVGQKNIALIPGTSTAVAINSVNVGSPGGGWNASNCTSLGYSSYFVYNGVGTNSPYNMNPYYVQYDGFTRVLTAKQTGLIPCQIYHLKLTVADVGDNFYDSGVFLEANSLRTNIITLDADALAPAMEGCTDGRIKFRIQQPVGHPVTTHFAIAGTATNGADYTWVADSITIAPNDTSADLIIHPLADGLTEGTETVKIYLINQCTNQPYDSAVLNIIDSLSLRASNDTSICIGTSAQLNATGSTTYLWTPATGLSNPNIANPVATPATTTTYICAASFGSCLSRDSVTVSVYAVPFTVSAGSDKAFCNGQSVTLDGSVTGNPVPGFPFQYQWAPAQGLNNINSLTPTANPVSSTNYSLTVTSGGCSRSDTVQVTVGNLNISSNHVNESCFGAANGSVATSIISGKSPYSYLWNNSAVTPSLTAVAPGTYSVVVTDADNCTAGATETVAAANAIYFNPPTVTPVSCFNGNDGAIAITAGGGAGGFTYAWSNGLTTSSISSLTINTYVVTVTDANGCRADTAITVPSSSSINVSLAVTHNVCYGDSAGTITATISGGTPPYTCNWSNGDTGVSIANLIAGNYTLTVNDNNNCPQVSSSTINQPTQLILNAPTIQHVVCFGGATGSIQVNATGGTGAYTYAWNPAGNTPVISGLTAGNYNVTVTDAAACRVSAVYQVTQPAAPLSISNAVVTDVSCYGLANGAINLTATGGTPNYSYAWNPAQTNSPQATALAAGGYNVTVTDAANCTTSGNYTVNQPAQMAFTQITATNTLCANSTDGTATAIATGGTGSITYRWSNNSTNSTATGLSPNTYTVTATDANNCAIDTAIAVTSPNVMTITLTPTHVSCFGAGDGSITSNVTGGDGNYTYSWSNATSGTGISNLAAGNYILTVTDGNNCQQTQSTTITEPAQLLLNPPVIVDVACFGGNNGSIQANPAGGTPPYSYAWSNGPTTQLNPSLQAGGYDVVVTDAINCTTSATYVVAGPAAALTIVNDTTINATCAGYTDGSVSLTVAGGTPNYRYVWSNDPGLNSSTNPMLQAGTYDVSVYDNNNCRLTSSYVVTEPAAIVFTQISATDAACFNSANGTATVIANGGAGSITYLWNNSETGSSIDSLAPATYTVTATDANSCQVDTAVTVNAPAAINATVATTPVGCNGDSTGTATVSCTGGTTPYTYAWNNTVSTASNNNLAIGSYSVTVSDNNLCTVSVAASITEPTLLSLLASATPPTCPGRTDGTVTAIATGSLPPYTFNLMINEVPVQTNSSGNFTGLSSGTYNVSVSDANNCTAVDTVLVTTAGFDVFSFSPTGTSCYGPQYADGTITVTPLSTTKAPFSFQLNGGPAQSTGEFTGLAAGNYQVAVTDKFGCSTDTTLTVQQPAQGIAEIMPHAAVITVGETIELKAGLTNYPSSSIISYEWSPGDGLSCINCPNPVAGSFSSNVYYVTITYHNSCVATASAQVVVEGQPPVFIPNVFTPNGDGTNDYFYIYGEGIRQIRLKIFDRWGELVFDTRNQFEGWDGTYKGIAQNPAVYVYLATIIYLDGSQIEKKGSVTLVR